MAADTANVTITGKIGPALTATALVLSGVSSISFQPGAGLVRIMVANQKLIDFDYTQISTITYTISSHVGTIAVS